MKLKKQISLLMLASLLASACACGQSADTTGGDTTTAAPDETTAEAGYDFQGKDFGGYKFRVLNHDEQYECYIYLDFEEQTGEALDDAVYLRNRKIEEKLNFELEEIKVSGTSAKWGDAMAAACDLMIQSVLADDDAYDAGYLALNFKPGLVTDGYVLNLLDIPELQVYEEYWDANINKELTVNDALYMASGPLNLMTLDLSWTLLFNQDMMDDLKMEYPYDLVRNGTWTLDKMREYVVAGKNLNGDESFKLSADGKSVYGIAGHYSSPMAFAYSAGHRFYTTDDSGIELNFESEKLYNVMDKIAKLCTNDGNIFYDNTGFDDPVGYMTMFSKNRALFITCEMKSVMELRFMESTFGLVPMPKYDENQENYYSEANAVSEFLVIPRTQRDPARAGLIIDALTYASYESVLPTYYEVTVSQKGLRNEDSIEMMQIIRNNRGIEITDVFGVNSTITTALNKIVHAGSGDASGTASTLASGKTAAETNLKTLIDALNSIE